MNGAARLLDAARRVVRSEGIAAAIDRLTDRVLEWRESRRFAIARPSEERLRSPILNVLPVPASARQGGLAIQLRRRLEVERAARPTALLYPAEGGYRLEKTSGGQWEASFLAAKPAGPEALDGAGFEDVVARAVAAVGARAVHFEGTGGLPVRSVARTRAVARVILSLHDFSLFCAHPHLVERPADRFCGYSRDLERCHRCLASTFTVPRGFQEAYREAGAEALAAADALVYPSAFMKEAHADLFPGTRVGLERVIAPGTVAREAPVIRSDGDQPPHVALVGAVHAHKGAAVFEDVVRLLRSRGRSDLRVSVLGGGDLAWLDRLRALGDVSVRGYYRAGTLERHLRKRRVSLALLLSITPESYGLTLDECVRARVPVVAFDHGAMADRIRATGVGVLVPLASGSEGIAAAIDGVLRGKPAVGVSTAACGGLPDVVQSARAHQALYGELGLR